MVGLSIVWAGHVLCWPLSGKNRTWAGHGLCSPWAGVDMGKSYHGLFWPWDLLEMACVMLSMVRASHGLGISCPRLAVVIWPGHGLGKTWDGRGHVIPSHGLVNSGHKPGWSGLAIGCLDMVWGGHGLGWTWACHELG
jgi:hypothetical protein